MQPECETDRFDDLKKNHYLLMVEYVNTLNQVSKLPFFVDSYQILGLPKKFLDGMILPRLLFKLLTWRFLVKFFVESHIKGKLIELKNSYIHIEQTIRVDENSNDKKICLKQTEEETVNFANTIISWQSAGWLISALGVIAGIFVAASNANNIYDAILNLPFESIFNFAGILVFFFFFVSFSFDCKRSLFRPGSGFIWESIMSQQQKESTRNLYLIEDRLFDLLGKAKNREFPIDIAAFSFWFILNGGILIVWQYIKNGPLLLIFMGGGFILIGIYGFMSGIKDRKWR